MQSVRRRIKRGHTVMTFNPIHKTIEIVDRKGTTNQQWQNAIHNRLEYSEFNYSNSVTMPLSKSDIDEAAKEHKRFIYKYAK